MQVEVVFVCLVLKFRWQSSLITEHLSASELQYARACQHCLLHTLQL